MERDEIPAIYEAGPEAVITFIVEQHKIIEQQAARIA